MGGDYTEGNTIVVDVVQCNGNTASHAMWHYANWCLWGREGDRLAWRGLSGFLGKEELIEGIMEDARKKAIVSLRETAKRQIEEGTFALLKPENRLKALEATLKTQKLLAEQGIHPLQNPEMRAKRARIDSERGKELFREGNSPLQKPEVIEKRKEQSSRFISSLNSTPIECHHCGKIGGYVNMRRYHFDNCKLIENTP
jgi:hypothetical protein